jgi:hypothetical protein
LFFNLGWLGILLCDCFCIFFIWGNPGFITRITSFENYLGLTLVFFKVFFFNFII